MFMSMESLCNPQRTMDEPLVIVQDFHHHVYNSCSSTSSSINGEEDDEEGEEEINSSPTPLQDMSSLLLQLPLKRGLSKHYNGKSQSFTSLSNVECLEDLAKQENPFNKKLKTCKSYGGFPRKYASSSSTKKPSNKRSHFSSHFNGRRNSSFLESTSNNYNNNNDNNNNNNNYYYNYNNRNINSNNRPPIHPPHRSTSRLIY